MVDVGDKAALGHHRLEAHQLLQHRLAPLPQGELVKAAADEQLAAILLLESDRVVAGVDLQREHAVEAHSQPERDQLEDVAVAVGPDHVDAVLAQQAHHRRHVRA